MRTLALAAVLLLLLGLTGCQSHERLHVRYGFEFLLEERHGEPAPQAFPAAFPSRPPPGYQGQTWPPR